MNNFIYCCGLLLCQHFLKTVNSSKTHARDVSQAALTEADLRAELGLLRTAKDAAAKEAKEAQMNALLLEDELRAVKSKLTLARQEKVKIERESRITLAMAKKPEIDTYSSSEFEFYKGKVIRIAWQVCFLFFTILTRQVFGCDVKATALSNHVQSLEAKLAEKSQEIEELRRQIERSLSQNRLAMIRSVPSRHKKP